MEEAQNSTDAVSEQQAAEAVNLTEKPCGGRYRLRFNLKTHQIRRVYVVDPKDDVKTEESPKMISSTTDQKAAKLMSSNIGLKEQYDNILSQPPFDSSPFFNLTQFNQQKNEQLSQTSSKKVHSSTLSLPLPLDSEKRKERHPQTTSAETSIKKKGHSSRSGSKKRKDRHSQATSEDGNIYQDT